MGVYQDLNRAIFKSKKEFTGSIIKQIDNVLEYYQLCNETRVVIDGSPMRKDYVSYYDNAAREAILNCYCHRDYSRRSNIKIEFFDDRCEFISPGGFYGGLTLEEAMNGVQSFRNKFLVQLLHRLGYIENYSSGLNRIFEEYKKVKKKPIIDTSLNMFKVTLLNLNYTSMNEIKDQTGENVGINVSQNVSQNVPQNVSQNTYEKIIVAAIENNNTITRKELALLIGKTVKTVQRTINNSNKIKYIGSSKKGHWEIIE